MKKILLPIIFALLYFTLDSQQLPQFSQYFMNDYSINPAVAGIRDQIEIRSNNRYQWEGITDAPRTYTLSLTSPLGDQQMGVGLFLFTDIVGPTRRIGIQGSYTYRFLIKEDLTLGLGFSAGVLEYSLDADKINLAQEGDPAILSNLGRSRVIDAKIGAYLNAENYYVGFSIPQVSKSNLELYATSASGSSVLETHMFLTAGYTYEINEEFAIEPNVIFKYVSPVPIKIDLSVRGIYKDMVWLGAGYRTDDAVIGMLGLKLNDRIIVGYSHDFTTSELKKYVSGTHEIMLGIDLPRPE